MQNLEKLIEVALKSQDNALRSQSERALLKFRQQNTQNFFCQLINIVKDNSKTTFIRQSACTVLGTSSVTKIPNSNKYYWDSLNTQAKTYIKDQALNLLISPQKTIVNVGAATISQFVAIQISHGQWLDLLQIFTENMNHEDIKIRRASIITIGYLCQKLKNMNASIPQRSAQQITIGIVTGILQKQSQEVFQQSLKAMKNSLSFLQPILTMKQIRSKIFEVLSQTVQNKNIQIVQQGYECLFQFCKNGYYFINQFLDAIIFITITHFRLRNQSTILALELWDTIGTQYLERTDTKQARINQKTQKQIITNYIQLSIQNILPEILQCMIIKNMNDKQFNQMRQAALKTLGTICESCSYNKRVIQIITNGVSLILNSENAGERQATALLFSALCQSQDAPKIKQLLRTGFDKIFLLLNDKEPVVIKNTLIGFSRIFESFGDVVLENKNIKQILNKFLTIANDADNDLKHLALGCLVDLTSFLQKTDCQIRKQPEFFFPKIVEYFRNHLFFFNENFKDGNEKTLLIIMNMVISTEKSIIIIDLIEACERQYEEIIQSKVKDKQILAGFMIAIIHTCILSLRNQKPSIQLMNEMCKLIHHHIKQFGVQNEGLSMISAIAITFNDAFADKIEELWPYISHGLQMTFDKTTFKAALNCLGDCARLAKDSFAKRNKQILENLIKVVHKDISREQRIQVLSCIGDLILGLKQLSELYVEPTITISNMCFNAVYELQKQPSEFEYVQELKQALVQMYTCLIYAINSSHKYNQLLFEHFPTMATFIVKTCDPSLTPTIQYLKSGLYLLFDAAHLFSKDPKTIPQVNRILDSNQIKKLIQLAETVKNKEQIGQLLIFIYSRKK